MKIRHKAIVNFNHSVLDSDHNGYLDFKVAFEFSWIFSFWLQRFWVGEPDFCTDSPANPLTTLKARESVKALLSWH